MKKQKKLVEILSLDGRRFKATYFLCLLMIIGLFGRIVNLQVFRASDLQKKSKSNSIH